MGKHALLVGIDNYSGNFLDGMQIKALPQLQGCVNDVTSLAQVLQLSFGFESTDIKILTNAAANQVNIQTYLQALVAAACPGDQVLFYFSGHGSLYTAPVAAGDQPAPIFSILCPADMDWNKQVFISMEWLKALVDTLQDNVCLEIVIDACSSGGMQDASRANFVERVMQFMMNMLKVGWDMLKSLFGAGDTGGSSARYLQPPADVQQRIEASMASGNSADIPVMNSDGPKRCIVWTASTAYQEAQEYVPPGSERHGAFTYWLIKALETEAGDAMPRSQLLAQVQQSVTAAGFKAQTPQAFPDSPYVQNKAFLVPGNFPPAPP